MKTVSIFLAILMISCGSTKDDSLSKQINFENSGKPTSDPNSSDVVDSVEGVTTEQVFSGQFSISGIPEGRHLKNSVELSLSESTELQGIEYAVGPSCAEVKGYDRHMDTSRSLEIDLTGYHGRVQLCIKAIDTGGITSERFEIFSWDQGYKNLPNSAFNARCRTSDDFIQSARYRVEIVKERPLSEIEAYLVTQRFLGPRCSQSQTPREDRQAASALRIENGIISFQADGQFYSFEIVEEEASLNLVLKSGIESEEDRTWSIEQI